jgi:hypothetical protein
MRNSVRFYVAMAREAITEELARSMLAKRGASIIWKLHNDAATLHRAGNFIAAESFLRIADAAEREWLRREPAHA